jgi:hypothetical protein
MKVSVSDFTRSVAILMVSFTLFMGCQDKNPFIPLFDGTSLEGWTASENKASFKVVDGAIVCDGPRSHLFYTGPVSEGVFKNFELQMTVKTGPNANSGIYFHTKYQEEGWPEKGYEAQIYCAHEAKGLYIERKKTGSLYAVRNAYKSPVKDGVWFNYRIRVEGNHIRIFINDHLVTDYVQSEDPWRPDNAKGRILSEGTFALQCHDPDSRVYFKDIQVKLLPDDLPEKPIPYDSEYDRTITELATANFPLIDYHIHLKEDLDLQGALDHARLYGITYGIAINCGYKFPIDSDEKLNEWLETYDQPPMTFLAMQAEGREWVDLITETSRTQFDYVFTDAMTWTNKKGKRMRLWMPDEVEVGDPQTFMDELVENIEKILTEPIDIYVNATFLPAEITDRYEELWTEARMDRVIQALLDNEVALEISARYQIPSQAFICRAKEAGVKFAFGTNNSNARYGNLEYCVEMIEACGLTQQDMYYPL